MRRDPQGNWLCMHCGRALEQDKSCRHCKGHVVGRNEAMNAKMDVIDAAREGYGGLSLYRLKADRTCKGCGHFLCSCAYTKESTIKGLRAEPVRWDVVAVSDSGTAYSLQSTGVTVDYSHPVKLAVYCGSKYGAHQCGLTPGHEGPHRCQCRASDHTEWE